MRTRGHAGRVDGRSKYGAIKTTVDGITFASQKEARRYGELKLLEKAGEITHLQLQPEFRLYSATELDLVHASEDARKVIGSYRGDFQYRDVRTGRRVVEDVKGFKTPLYRWKKKHVEAQYGITVVEI